MKSPKHSLVPRYLPNFIVMSLKIATEQNESFTFNQDFQRNLANSQYTLQKIARESNFFVFNSF